MYTDTRLGKQEIELEANLHSFRALLASEYEAVSKILKRLFLAVTCRGVAGRIAADVLRNLESPESAH